MYKLSGKKQTNKKNPKTPQSSCGRIAESCILKADAVMVKEK